MGWPLAAVVRANRRLTRYADYPPSGSTSSPPTRDFRTSQVFRVLPAGRIRGYEGEATPPPDVRVRWVRHDHPHPTANTSFDTEE